MHRFAALLGLTTALTTTAMAAESAYNPTATYGANGDAYVVQLNLVGQGAQSVIEAFEEDLLLSDVLRLCGRPELAGKLDVTKPVDQMIESIVRAARADKLLPDERAMAATAGAIRAALTHYVSGFMTALEQSYEAIPEQTRNEACAKATETAAEVIEKYSTP